MQFAADEIVQLSQDIFATMLQLEVAVADLNAPRAHDTRLTGCVQIAGVWKGAVMVDAPVQRVPGTRSRAALRRSARQSTPWWA